MTGPIRWPDAVVVRARLLYSRGYGYWAVAQALADEMPQAPSWHSVRDWCAGRARRSVVAGVAPMRARGWRWRPWTPAEDARLMAHPRPTTAALARALGRTRGAVKGRLHRLRTGRVNGYCAQPQGP